MTPNLAWFETDKRFVDGRWVRAQANEFLPLEDPSRGAEIGSIAPGRSAGVVIAFDDGADAIAIANVTGYGLVAGAWTADGGRQMRLAGALRSGQVFINDYGAGGGVELPFGGIGKSGHGREKGFEALYGFTALKTVAVWHG